MHIALDSSVLLALLNPDDVWHGRAIALQDAMVKADADFVYFDCVIAETISAVARRLHEKGKSDEVKTLLERLESQASRDLITWILPDAPRLYSEVLELIRTTSGELNFNDALIALICRERNIPLLASFDSDFDHVIWLKRVAIPSDITASAS
jgi:predicted nucleic acid-binding protein